VSSANRQNWQINGECGLDQSEFGSVSSNARATEVFVGICPIKRRVDIDATNDDQAIKCGNDFFGTEGWIEITGHRRQQQGPTASSGDEVVVVGRGNRSPLA
jgi:hypothetical protein